MSYNFKKFTGVYSKTDDRISLTKSYTVGLPGHFVRENLPGKPRYAVLYYDANSVAVGIRFTSDSSEDGRFAVVYSKASAGAMIIARSFFRLNRLEPEMFAGKYKWHKRDVEGAGQMFIVDLDQSLVST